MPLDQMEGTGGSYKLSVAGIADGLSIESFSFATERGGSGKESKLTRVSITRRVDKHSPTIHEAAATGRPIASAELQCRRSSGTVTFKMQNVVVASYQLSSGDEIEAFTLDFTDFSVEQPKT